MELDTGKEQRNLSLMRRWITEVWNERREETIDELMTPDALNHGVGDDPVDREGFKAGWRGIQATFEGFGIEIEGMIASGEFIACRLVLSGVHVGQGLGVVPSGKPLRFAAHTYTQWRDGRCVAGWNVIDMAAAYRQIGCTIV